jgi:hypothetical protein
MIINDDHRKDASTLSRPAAYLPPRDPDVLRSKLRTLEKKRHAVDPNKPLEYLQFTHRIASFAYALGGSPEDLSAILQPALLGGHRILAETGTPIDPSTALALWGSAAIAKEQTLIETLQTLDPNRIGSIQMVPRYARMLVALFTAIQHLSVGNKQQARFDIIAYDKQYFKKQRLQSRALEHAFSWSLGLRAMLALIDDTTQAFQKAVDDRAQYLTTAYNDPAHQYDHESLLDLHGLGVLSIAQRYGRKPKSHVTALPLSLIAE